MSEANSQESSNKRGVLVSVLLGAVLALMISQVYTLIRLNGVQGKVAGLESENANSAKSRQSMAGELARLREHADSETAASVKRIESLQEELKDAQTQSRISVGWARQDALKSAKTLEAKLAAEERKLGEQHTQMASQLSEVQQVASNAHAKISDVNADVSSVKAEVASTRSELDRTASDLRKTVGDMGVMSGLIATNSKEFAALKALGDRNYFEFTLAKTKQPQVVSNIRLMLKKVDAKRNRFTLDVLAEDRKIEKKDKTINEPVQFYLQRSRQPYELVINEVRKDQVVGYLAAPKALVARE